jgi:hypothetical protein
MFLFLFFLVGVAQANQLAAGKKKEFQKEFLNNYSLI